jgi:hypothetical protein
MWGATVSDERALRYRCGPAIAWVKDADRIFLVQEGEAQSWSLDGVEAIVWDLLALNYPLKQLTSFLSVLLNVSSEEANHTLLDVLRKWEKAGILQAEGGNGRG